MTIGWSRHVTPWLGGWVGLTANLLVLLKAPIPPTLVTPNILQLQPPQRYFNTLPLKVDLMGKSQSWLQLIPMRNNQFIHEKEGLWWQLIGWIFNLAAAASGSLDFIPDLPPEQSTIWAAHSHCSAELIQTLSSFGLSGRGNVDTLHILSSDIVHTRSTPHRYRQSDDTGIYQLWLRKEANKDDDCSSTLTVMVVMMPRVCGAPAMMGGSLGAGSLHWNAALPHWSQREACWREETSNLPPNTWSKWNWCNLELLDTNTKSLGAVETNKKARHWEELS